MVDPLWRPIRLYALRPAGIANGSSVRRIPGHAVGDFAYYRQFIGRVFGRFAGIGAARCAGDRTVVGDDPTWRNPAGPPITGLDARGNARVRDRRALRLGA